MELIIYLYWENAASLLIWKKAVIAQSKNFYRFHHRPINVEAPGQKRWNQNTRLEMNQIGIMK